MTASSGSNRFGFRLALGATEVAKLIGISRSTVYRLLESGEIWSRKAGDRLIVPVPALLAFLEGRKYDPSAPTLRDAVGLDIPRDAAGFVRSYAVAEWVAEILQRAGFRQPEV